MKPGGPVALTPEPADGKHAPDIQGQFRGSSLLLGGRFVAIGLNLVVQVLMVRYLTREEYGSFSFVLSIVALLGNLNLLGLARAMSRFGPLYGEKEDPRDLVGAIAVSLGAVTIFGILIVGGALIWDGRWQPWISSNPLSRELLVLMIALTPLAAIDAVLEVLSASFAGARAIFVRRHLLTPLLRLAAVLFVIATGQGTRALAACYIAAAVVGIAAYAIVLKRALARRGIHSLWPRCLPVRAIMGYGGSMWLVDIAGVSILHFPAVVLEMARGSTAVAGLRAVAPLATLTLIVFQSFKLLYVPLATRSFERGGVESLSEVYWASTRWLGILTFPVFACCTFLSPLLVVAFYGAEYRDASSLAAIMACGYYLHAILGVNTLTLQALGDGRGLRFTALAGITTAIVANSLLVPRFGAVGAAIATSLTLLAHDLTNLWLLVKGGRVGPPTSGFARPYFWVLGVSTLLFFSVTLASPPALASTALVLAGIGLVWATTWRSLGLLEAFPELARIPIVGRLLS